MNNSEIFGNSLEIWTLPFFRSEKVRKFELCHFLCRKKLGKLDLIIFNGGKGWPTLDERHLKTRLIMMYKITHALIAIPNNILVPTDSRTRKSHNQTFRHDDNNTKRYIQMVIFSTRTLPFFRSEKVRKFELCHFLCRKKLGKLDLIIFNGGKSAEI
jgi:hypothetical protein